MRFILPALAACAVAAAPFLLLCDPAAAAQSAAESPEALGTVAVRVAEGAKIESVAHAHGAVVRHPVGSLRRWWVIEFADAAAASSAIAALRADKLVEDAHPQFRGRFEYRTNDPLFASQWHLKKSGAANVDINAEPAWNAGFTGSGINLMVCDDSLEHTHPDLAPNYNAADSYDYNSSDTDPAPASSNEQHGTATSGLAAARGDNSAGVAGVAYNATLSGIRMEAAFSDAGIAGALSHSQGNIDIYSNSWGPMPWQAMGPLTRQAIENGIASGRGGKGCIYVWASGNGRFWGDNSNNDPFQNMPETISVSSMAIDGAVADHSERGASILVAAPAGVSSGGMGGGGGNVVTTDLTGADGYGGLADADYTNTFGGTSASCPIVAGTCALILQANPNLTWRDAQHILVETANSTNGVSNAGWTMNGAGKRIHDTLGFGCVDAGAAVALAQGWTNVAARVTETTPPDNAGVGIPDGNTTGITRSIFVTNNVTIEHVVLELQSNHQVWDDLRITLTSPSGTVSVLAQPPLFPFPGGTAPTTWDFMTTRCWGETAGGTWTLNVADLNPSATGSLTSWRLKIHGTGGGVVTPTPTLSLTGTLPNLLAPNATTPSNAASYMVSGTDLVGNVDITAPAGFELAESSGGPWQGMLSLTPTAGAVSATIFARYDPAVAGLMASGQIDHSSAGATSRQLNVSGSVAQAGNPNSGSGGNKNGGGGGCAAGVVAPPLPLVGLGVLLMRRRRR